MKQCSGNSSSLGTSCILAAFVLASVIPACAQGLAAERDRVLQVVGETKALDLSLFPLAPAVGLVFRQEITESEAKSLRVHFVIRRPGESWGIQVRDEAGIVKWSTWDAVVKRDRFWSDEINGKKATIEVYSSMPSNSLQLFVDKLAVGMARPTPVSITGVNQLSSILGQDDWIVDLGRSVARLRFVGDGGKVFVCTAFLVTQEILLTNQHCIASQSELESALVDFDFDGPVPSGQTLHLSEVLSTNFGLDYSLLRLPQSVARTPLRLDLTRPADNEALLIIQHPAGEAKQVSLADCRVDGAQVTGRGGNPTDFGHQCDTMGGSSGSPVIHFGRRTVVGLHHLGITPGSFNLFNRATHIGFILDALDSALRAEIEAAQ